MSEKKKKTSSVKQKYKMLNDRASKYIKDHGNSPDDDDEDENSEEKKGIFRKHIENIKALEKRGVTGEAYDVAVLKSLHELTLSLIPIAEDNYIKFPIHTAASAVNGFLNQSREILADIRALEDFQARADRLVAIVDAEYNDLARELIENIGTVRIELESKNGLKYLERTVKGFLTSQGKVMEESKKRVGAKITQMLVSSDAKK